MILLKEIKQLYKCSLIDLIKEHVHFWRKKHKILYIKPYVLKIEIKKLKAIKTKSADAADYDDGYCWGDGDIADYDDY